MPYIAYALQCIFYYETHYFSGTHLRVVFIAECVCGLSARAPERQTAEGRADRKSTADFEEVSRRPRHKQQRILGIIEDLITAQQIQK